MKKISIMASAVLLMAMPSLVGMDTRTGTISVIMSEEELRTLRKQNKKLTIESGRYIDLLQKHKISIPTEFSESKAEDHSNEVLRFMTSVVSVNGTDYLVLGGKLVAHTDVGESSSKKNLLGAALLVDVAKARPWMMRSINAASWAKALGGLLTVGSFWNMGIPLPYVGRYIDLLSCYVNPIGLSLSICAVAAYTQDVLCSRLHKEGLFLPEAQSSTYILPDGRIVPINRNTMRIVKYNPEAVQDFFSKKSLAMANSRDHNKCPRIDTTHEQRSWLYGSGISKGLSE